MKSNASDVVGNAPKELNKEYLIKLYCSLSSEECSLTPDANDVAKSILLFVLDDKTPNLERCFAVAVLRKMPPISGVIEILSSASVPELINAFPCLFSQDICEEIYDIALKLIWSLQNDNLHPDQQKAILSFLSRVLMRPNSQLCQDDIKKIFDLLPNWISNVILPRIPKSSRFQRSMSNLSINEIDGTESRSTFTVLNYSQATTAEQLLHIQSFSMLHSWLCSTRKSHKESGNLGLSSLSDCVSGDLSIAVEEYCTRIVDQTAKKASSIGMVEYQKACLVEAISLLDLICQADSSKVHSILPTIKRIYKEVSDPILANPEAQDVAVLTAAMQFFINHGSYVMYRHDSLYPFLFSDVLNACYKDTFASFEIISLMKENLAQLCYHSSVLEKFFPTFFKVLAWWPTTFDNEFLHLLPAFMSQNTSLEVFHTLLDLPCLSAVLVVMSCKVNVEDEVSSADLLVLQQLKKPQNRALLDLVLRRTSSLSDAIDRVGALHDILIPVKRNARVVACAESSLTLIRHFFSVFLQYAETYMVVQLLLAMLERLVYIYDVPKYANRVCKIFSDYVVELFQKHPVAIFHCQKKISSYLTHTKNYDLSQDFYTHLVWAIGEFVSVTYSEFCCPEVIMSYYQHIEAILYEIIGNLTVQSDEAFLKLISVTSSTIAKLAARNQGLIPRTVLVLSKVHQQIISFDNSYLRNWKIVNERVLELLNVLNTPNVASVILSPPKDLNSGRLHRDATSLPFVLKAVTALLDTDASDSNS